MSIIVRITSYNIDKPAILLKKERNDPSDNSKLTRGMRHTQPSFSNNPLFVRKCLFGGIALKEYLSKLKTNQLSKLVSQQIHLIVSYVRFIHL